MSSSALYGNVTAPQLGFERILPSLSWLPGEVAKYASRSTTEYIAFSTILNIVLVFAGARTAALLDNLNSNYSPFIQRLNDALFETGQSAFRLDVNEFYMGEFIFRENNPRFIHSHAQRLGHREIGHNLDFFAPANIDAITDDKFGISIHEMQSWVQVTGEVVAKHCIQSEKHMQRLKRFTDQKVDLFNRAFQGLNLPYRFEWSFLAPSLDHIMTNKTPPSREWWEENWFNVAWSTVGYRPHLRHMFADYEKTWDVITTIWELDLWAGVWMGYDEDFRRRLEAVYDQVGDYISRGIPIDIDNLSLGLAKLNEEGRVEMMKFRKEHRGTERLEIWRTLKRIIRGELGYWFNVSKREKVRVQVIGGVDCPLLKDENYWSFMIRRVARIIRYGIFG